MESQRALAAANLFIAALEYNDLSCEEGFYRLDHDADGFLSLEDLMDASEELDLGLALEDIKIFYHAMSERGELIELDRWIKYMWRDNPKQILFEKIRSPGHDSNMFDSSLSAQTRLHESDGGEGRFSDQLEKNNSSISSRSFNLLDSSLHTEVNESSTQTDVVAEALRPVLPGDRERDPKEVDRTLKIQLKMSNKMDEVIQVDDFQNQVVMDCCQAFSLQADTFRIENVLFGKEIIINLASLPAPTESQRLDAHPFYKQIVNKLEEDSNALTGGKFTKYATSLRMFTSSSNDPVGESSDTFVMKLAPAHSLSTSLQETDLTKMLAEQEQLVKSLKSIVDKSRSIDSLSFDSSRVEDRSSESRRDSLREVGRDRVEDTRDSYQDYRKVEKNYHVQVAAEGSPYHGHSISADTPSNRRRLEGGGEEWEKGWGQISHHGNSSSAFGSQRVDRNGVSTFADLPAHHTSRPDAQRSDPVKSWRDGNSADWDKDNLFAKNPQQEIFRGLSVGDLNELRSVKYGEDIESAISLAMRYESLRRIHESKAEYSAKKMAEVCNARDNGRFDELSRERASPSLSATQTKKTEPSTRKSGQVVLGNDGNNPKRRIYFSTRYQTSGRRDAGEGDGNKILQTRHAEGNKIPFNSNSAPELPVADPIRWPWQSEKQERLEFPWNALQEELKGVGSGERDSQKEIDRIFNLHYKDVSSSKVSLADLRRHPQEKVREEVKVSMEETNLSVPRARLLARTAQLSLEEEEKRALRERDDLFTSEDEHWMYDADTTSCQEGWGREDRPREGRGQERKKPGIEEEQEEEGREGGGEGQEIKLDRVYGVSSSRSHCPPLLSHRGSIVHSCGHVNLVLNLRAQEQFHFSSHLAPISCSCLHSDGKIVATAESADIPIIIVWDCEMMMAISRLRPTHRKSITCMNFSTEDDLLVSVASDEFNSITLWDWKSASKVAHVFGSKEKILSVTFLKRNSSFMTCGDRHLKVWKVEQHDLDTSRAFIKNKSTESLQDMQTYKLVGRKGNLVDMSSVFLCCLHSQFGLVAGTSAGDLVVWEEEDLRVRLVVPAHQGQVLGATSWQDDNFISYGQDRMIRSWTFGHDAKLSCSFSISLFEKVSDHLAVTARHMDVNDMRVVLNANSTKEGGDKVNIESCSVAGDELLVCTTKKQWILVNLDDIADVSTPSDLPYKTVTDGVGGQVSSLDVFTDDNQQLRFLSLSDRGIIKMWKEGDVKGEQILPSYTKRGATSIACCVVPSPANTMFLLAVSYEDSSIIVFDLASRAILSDLRVTNMFAKIAFLKFDLLRDARLVVGMEDGAILVYSSSSSSHDRFLREWTTRLLPRLPSVEPLGRVERADWSSSGNFLRACGGGQEKGRNDEMGRGEEKGRGESGSRRDWLAVWRLPQGEEAAVLVLARASGSQKIFEAADFYALRKGQWMSGRCLLGLESIRHVLNKRAHDWPVTCLDRSTDGDCVAFANSRGSIFLLRKLKKNEDDKSKNGTRDVKKLSIASIMRPHGQMVSGVIMGKKDQLFTWSKQEGCIFQWTRR